MLFNAYSATLLFLYVVPLCLHIVPIMLMIASLHIYCGVLPLYRINILLLQKPHIIVNLTFIALQYYIITDANTLLQRMMSTHAHAYTDVLLS